MAFGSLEVLLEKELIPQCYAEYSKAIANAQENVRKFYGEK